MVTEGRNVPIYSQPEEEKLWRKSSEYRFWVRLMKLKLTVGRAPIDPNFVLAIERNQQNQMNEVVVGETVANGVTTIRTIVDEYQQLALHDVFKGIVLNLMNTVDDKRQE